MKKLPIAVNNFYACTIPQIAKNGQERINARLAAILNRLSRAISEITE